MFRKGHEAGGKRPGRRHPAADWVAHAEQQAALAERLTLVLKGEAPPKDNRGCIPMALMCAETRRFATAARSWPEAMEREPKLGDSLQSRARHQAAGVATLAGVGRGEEELRLNDAARSRLRIQARDCLRADLRLCSQSLDTGNAKDRVVVVQALQHWNECDDLAVIRDAEALAKLPEAERKEWQPLWADFEVLLNRAQAQAS
jgi:hypothetical protein